MDGSMNFECEHDSFISSVVPFGTIVFGGFGHSDSDVCKNSGPVNYRSVCTKVGFFDHFVASSATFNLLGTYLHSDNSVVSKISPTR